MGKILLGTLEEICRGTSRRIYGGIPEERTFYRILRETLERISTGPVGGFPGGTSEEFLKVTSDAILLTRNKFTKETQKKFPKRIAKGILKQIIHKMSKNFIRDSRSICGWY